MISIIQNPGGIGKHTSSAISFLMRILFALKKSSRDFCSSLFTLEFKIIQTKIEHLPIDVAELVFTQATLQPDSDVKCTAG